MTQHRLNVLDSKCVQKGGSPSSTTPAEVRTPTKSKCDHEGDAVVHLNWTMRVCIVYSGVAFLLLVCCAPVGIGPRWTACNTDEVWHTGASLLLVFSSMVMEACLAAATSYNKQILVDMIASEEKLNFPGIGDHGLTLSEYGIKVICGMYIWFGSGGIIHTDTLAGGGARPVYAARFAQWSVAVPVLVLITNKAFIDSVGPCFRRSFPAAVTAFFYVWMGWLMQVTTAPFVRWLTMFMALSGAAIVSADQIQLAKQHRNTKVFNPKLGMLAYQIWSFGVYAVVFLSGRFGLISSGTEQITYAYLDVTVKVLQGAMLAMIRNREGALEMRHWWTAASAASSDLRDLLHQAKVPTLAIDLSGTITDWNDSIARLTGLAKEKVQGRFLVELASAACKEDLRNDLQQRLDGFSAAHATCSPQDNYPMLELSIPTLEDGSQQLPNVRIFAMMFVPKRDSSKNLVGAVAIGQDLSELTELKLVQERKNALTAMLSHEFRSPLHGMIGLVGVLMENPAAEKMKRQLGMVKGCAGRLLDLVTDVMTLAECEKRKMDGLTESRPTTPVDFGSILDEAVAMIGNSADKANKPLLKPSVRIVNNAAGSKMPLVHGDPYKCTQVIYNLLTNACKFTDRGNITISCHHLKQDKVLAIDIADTGKGISDEAQERIFKPFEQESTKDVRSFQGIGLGLSVCKQVAQNHGGKLSVKSTVGQGSTFTFSLPCTGELGFGQNVQEAGFSNKYEQTEGAKKVEKQPEVVGQVEKKSESAKELEKKSELSEQILLKDKTPLVLSVDDDEVNQEVIRNALKDCCEVVCLMDGFATLKYLEEVQKSQCRCPDLVLLDIQMPGMTGFEVCDAIRTTFAYLPGKLPVTMVSAKAPADSVAVQAFDCGSTDFVAKPFDREVLKRKVVAALNIQATMGSASSAYVLAQEAQKMVQMHKQSAEMACQQVGKLQEEREKLQSATDALQQQVDSLKSESLNVEACKKEREHMEKTASILQEEVKRLKSVAESESSRVDALKAERGQMQKVTSNLQEEMERLKNAANSSKDALKAERERMQKSTLALQEEVKRLKSAASSESSSADTYREEREQMQQTIPALEEESERLKSASHPQVSGHAHSNPDSTDVAESPMETQQLMEELESQRNLNAQLQQQLDVASTQRPSGFFADKTDAICKVQSPRHRLQGGPAHVKERMNSYRAVKLLACRLQRSGCIARECREILDDTLFAGMAADGEEQTTSFLEDFKLCSKVVSSELAMLEQVTSNIDNITGLAPSMARSSPPQEGLDFFSRDN